jgi:hypothetical protein
MNIKVHRAALMLCAVVLVAASVLAGTPVQLGQEVVTGVLQLPGLSREPTLSLNRRGYVGAVFGDSTPNVFVLYDSSGRQCFTVSSPAESRFTFVDMTCDTVVVVAAVLGEDDFVSFGYDGTGKRLFGPVRNDSPLRTSTQYRFLYTSNCFTTSCPPKVFSTDGALLAQLAVHSLVWEMYPLGDTAVLLQDLTTVKLISVPGFSELREYRLPDIRSYENYHTSLSPDGRAFAVSGDGRIAVLDLATGSVAEVPMEFKEERGERFCMTRRFTLTPGGARLLLQDRSGNVMTIYRLAEGKYVRIAGGPAVPAGGGHPYGVCFAGNYCVLNYHRLLLEGMAYRVVAFDYGAAEGDQYPAVAISGLARPALDDSTGRLVMLKTAGAASAATGATVVRISLQEGTGDAE